MKRGRESRRGGGWGERERGDKGERTAPRKDRVVKDDLVRDGGKWESSKKTEEHCG